MNVCIYSTLHVHVCICEPHLWRNIMLNKCLPSNILYSASINHKQTKFSITRRSINWSSWILNFIGFLSKMFKQLVFEGKRLFKITMHHQVWFSQLGHIHVFIMYIVKYIKFTKRNVILNSPSTPTPKLQWCTIIVQFNLIKLIHDYILTHQWIEI